MAFRIRSIERTANGREIVRERDLAATSLRIGRAAECEIALPDLAVEPHQATIEAKGDGRIAITAAGTLGFLADGVTAREAIIDCGEGGELGFGSSRIGLTLAEDGLVVLTVARLPAAGGGELGKSGMSLAAVLPSRRAVGWITLIAIFAAFLALPITSHMTRGTGPDTQVTGDASWSPGKLSRAHHALEQKCEACHVKGFESVRDSSCLACHKDIGGHANAPRLQLARGEAAGGERLQQTIAHQFGKPGPGACVDCHNEHLGTGRMEPVRQQFCTDCHAGLKRRLQDSALGDAGDFGLQHPQFMPALVIDPVTRSRARVSLDAHPREKSGLAFSHKLHLDPLGGAARMAARIGAERDYGRRLACKDCHRPSEDRIRFQPIRMERDCEGCHSLVYDRIGATFRTLKHGQLDQAMADLSVAQRSGSIVPPRQRPGSYAPGGNYHANFTPPLGGSPLQRALAKGGLCGECHTAFASAGRTAIVPVTLPARAMTNGWFSHKPHAQQSCSSCHGAATSASASDVLLPGIGQCRTCHLGEDSKAKVPSGCAMCHSYHPLAGAPRGAAPAKRQDGD